MVGVGRAIPFITGATILVFAWTVPVLARQGGTANGGDLFRTYCVACHGADAKGTGPLAASLSQRPADLTAIATTNGGEFDAALVARIIDGRNPVKGHGGGDMPAWGQALSRSQSGSTEEAVQERIEALVSYLRGVQQSPRQSLP